jgi:hypothetical protein
MIPVCSSATRLLHSGAAQRLLALLSNSASQQQQQQQWHYGTGWQRRSVWNESIDQREARKADSFYDSTIERVRCMVGSAAVLNVRTVNISDT